jgi:lysophospholipase L1-like esterase
LKKIVNVIYINFLLIFIATIIAELIFGGWIGDNYGVLVIPKDFKRRFDVKELYTRDHSIIDYTRDKNGLRGSDTDPETIDILAVGGSTTNELFVDDTETWTAVLQNLFQSNGMQIKVVNGGVDGQSTIGHIANFDYWYPKIEKFKPRYFLFYVGINDTAITKSGYLSKQDRLINPQKLIKQYIMNNSAIYTLFRNVRGIVRARKANLIQHTKSFNGYKWSSAATQPNFEIARLRYRDELNAYSRRLQLLIKRTRSLGAVPIIVTQHDATYRLRGNRVLGRITNNGGIDFGNYVILAVHNYVAMLECKKAEAICIDLFSYTRFRDGDHYDAVHTTPQGSLKIGNFLFRELKEKIQLAPIDN